ncbi:WYL domain-containing protein [Proteus terrae]|uniref:WYL domain-containing protein n=1 Tax=Proteus terrae TaxID=1574161 RepID=UPI0032DA967F
MKNLDDLPHAQKERLAFIDFCLNYYGEISRVDLIARFQTGLAAATRDFTTYKEFAVNNLELNHQTKSYHRTNRFIPLFKHETEEVLASLTRGFGNGLAALSEASQVCIEAPQLNKPSTDILSAVMRAISQKALLDIEYVSLSSGASHRVIVPHSLANNGSRWHIRAFDRSSQSFRGFVITRIKTAKLINDVIEASRESIAADKQWNRIVDLTFIPHPKAKYPQAIELDYAMVDGQLEVECRAAMAGYLLHRWNVDCSKNNQLDAMQYQLALKDEAVLYGVDSSYLAPGYLQNNKHKDV